MHKRSIAHIDHRDSVVKTLVWEHYETYGRELPWRKLDTDIRQRLYQVVVSELMLQQTQVTRVVEKYAKWMDALPTMATAAAAPLSQVLTLWNGLGYNRRARYLHDSLKQLHFRKTEQLFDQLTTLPGIGVNTAGAIKAYAADQPSVYIETNIRTVVIHHYFQDNTGVVGDELILPIVGRILDKDRPKEWYWALMDYGSFLKKQGNNISRSRHYKKQTQFSGSSRQLRGAVMRELVTAPIPISALHEFFHDERITAVIDELIRDRLVQKFNGEYRLADT
jgi:A/G-specific adenine glycosylase